MKHWAWIAAILFGSITAAADFTGTFKGEQLSFTITESQGKYSGTIQLADRQYPATARAVGNELRGSFAAGADSFDFTATLQGDALSLVTGGATWHLQRQKPAAVNPLARPAPANPLAKPAGDNRPPPAATGAASAGILRLRKISIQDQPNMIGGEAFTFLVPVNWTVEGGLVWRAHPTMPASVALRAFNPANLDQFENFPTVAFSWGGLLAVTGFPQGSNYLGNEVQPPVRDALAYLKERHLPRVRGTVQARVIGEEELPRLAEAARAAENIPPVGGPDVRFTAGRVRIAYDLNGKPVEEELYCVLNTMTLPPGNFVIQVADKLFAVRAEKGRLADATRVAETMIHSTRMNAQWFNRYVQLCQALTQMQMDRIRAAGEISKIISRTSNEISDMMMKSYQERQASQDRINKNWSQYMRGVDEYRDPVAGRPVELPSGYSNAWTNGAGEYLVTDSALFNPGVELGGNWQKLEKAGP